MDNLIYLSMHGAENVLLAQQNNSHNLANANTAGFKADLNAFKTLPVYGPGHPVRAYTEDTGIGYNFDGGSLQHTGRDLDLAIAGDGWMVVQGADGRDGLTRRGDLRIDTTGLLTNGAGDLVMGNGGPIAIPPHETLLIGRDGTISVRPLGQPAATLAVVDRIQLVNPPLTQLEKGSDGLFRTRDGSAPVPDAAVTVTGGALESSNVNAVQALVQMIELARMFEHQVKLMEVAERNDESSASLLNVN